MPTMPAPPIDVAERHRNEVVEDPGGGDRRAVEPLRRVPRAYQQPGERQEVHVGDAVLEASRDEGGDRQYHRHDLVGDRPAGIGEPDRRADQHVAQDSLTNSVTTSGRILPAAVFSTDRPTRPSFMSRW